MRFKGWFAYLDKISTWNLSLKDLSSYPIHHLPLFFYSSAFYVICVLQIQIFFFLRFSFDLLLWSSTSSMFSISRFSSSDPIFSKSSSSSSIDPDLLFLHFFQFSPSPSSNLLLWNSRLSNSSSMLHASSRSRVLKTRFCHRS